MTGGFGSPAPPTAAIVSVGDELLSGQTVDTNGAWLAEGLTSLGLRVVGQWVVGDVPDEISQALRSALDLADLVLVTGGLGPTPDDVTRETVAKVFEAPLSVDPNLLVGLKARFRSRGVEALPKGSESMAEVPMDALVLPNLHGAAPGLLMETGKGKLCILLPGIPREMRGIFRLVVEPFVRDRFDARLMPAVHRVIHTFGVPESVLMTEIRDLAPRGLGEVSMAYLPDRLGVRVRLSARGEEGTDEAHARLQVAQAILDPVLSKYRYEAESGDLAEAVGHALVQSGNTLAVAESCTGGLLAKRLTDYPGSSRFLVGGVVAYANEVKAEILGIEEALIGKHGVVSEPVAKGMAAGVSRLLNTTLGMGVTGIAGPGGGSPEKPVGTVCYAVSFDGETMARRERFLGDREAVRDRAAHAALGFLLRLLREREGR